MKNEIVIKEGKWIWPKNDSTSWDGQNNNVDLVNQIMPFVKNRKVMIQAGGNCGFILSTFLDKFDVIYTFEPDPLNFYCLNQNITDKKVIKLQSCLGYEKNTVLIKHLDREKIDIGGTHVSGPGNTPTISIDSLNLPGCDLIQLDVEGYELKALLGAVETIKKYKPVLCVEFCEKWLKRYGDSCEILQSFIEGLGYKHIHSFNVDKIFIPK